MTTVNNQQWGMCRRNVEEKLDYRCFLNTVTLDCVDVDVTPSNQPFIPAFSNFDRMTLEPNTAASVYDSQLVTMANIHCSSNEIQSYPDGESMTAEEIFRYLHWTNNTSCQFAVDFGFATYNAAGLFEPDGHKAICLDKSIAPAYNN